MSGGGEHGRGGRRREWRGAAPIAVPQPWRRAAAAAVPIHEWALVFLFAAIFATGPAAVLHDQYRMAHPLAVAPGAAVLFCAAVRTALVHGPAEIRSFTEWCGVFIILTLFVSWPMFILVIVGWVPLLLLVAMTGLTLTAAGVCGVSGVLLTNAYLRPRPGSAPGGPPGGYARRAPPSAPPHAKEAARRDEAAAPDEEAS